MISLLLLKKVDERSILILKVRDEIYLAVGESGGYSVGYDEAGGREKYLTGREIVGDDIYPVGRGKRSGLSKRNIACLFLP